MPCHSAEDRGHLLGVDSLLLLYEFQGLDSGHYDALVARVFSLPGDSSYWHCLFV